MSLKEQTKDLHETAENNPFAQRLLSGNISINEYACYLTNLEPIYNTIESIAQEIKLLSDDMLPIKRTELIREDLAELKQMGADHCVILESTIHYINYLKHLDKDKILAHLYTRHFGDLYGGQILKAKVPGSGKMYEFTDRKALIDTTRMMLSDDLGPEARIAFQHAIYLFEGLNNEFNI